MKKKQKLPLKSIFLKKKKKHISLGFLGHPGISGTQRFAYKEEDHKYKYNLGAIQPGDSMELQKI
jgi:hypothetical protein